MRACINCTGMSTATQIAPEAVNNTIPQVSHFLTVSRVEFEIPGQCALPAVALEPAYRARVSHHRVTVVTSDNKNHDIRI